MNDFFEKNKINDNVIAVGVSGGADSLALLWMLNNWAKDYNKKIVALTVDHGLREESAYEANYVAQIAKQWGIEHHILLWEGDKPQTGIEEKARKMRYSLLLDWCENNNVYALAIAHHLYDQAETFFLRLHRGSGLDGLCGMLPVSYMRNIKIIRPLLNAHPDVLKKTLLDINVEWMEDPSNFSDDFLRVRIRKFLPVMEKEIGVDAKKIVSTMERLLSPREYLENKCQKFIKNNVKNWDDAGYSFSFDIWRYLDEEMCFRILNCLFKKLTGNDYPPRAEDVLRLIKESKKERFKSATLGGCNVILFNKNIWLIKEQKESKGPDKAVWNLWLENNPRYKNLHLPYKLRLSLLQNRPIYNK